MKQISDQQFNELFTNFSINIDFLIKQQKEVQRLADTILAGTAHTNKCVATANDNLKDIIKTLDDTAQLQQRNHTTVSLATE